MAVAGNAGAYDAGRSSFAAWLFTIARNKVRDHFRKQKVAFLVSGEDDAAMKVADTGPTPLERVETRELALKLVAAVEALPLAQRETFAMFALGGLTLDEIARATDAGAETAKSRLRYARSTLRRVLSGQRCADG